MSKGVTEMGFVRVCVLYIPRLIIKPITFYDTQIIFFLLCFCNFLV